MFAICDIAPWDFRKAAEANISVQIVSYLSYFIFTSEGASGIFANDSASRARLEEMEVEYSGLVNRFGGATQLLNAVTRDCKEMIFYCRMGLLEDISGAECCRRNFNPPVYTSEGKCFGTAGKMAFKQPDAVKQQGMTIGLVIGPDISSTFDVTTGAFQAMLQRGVALVTSGPDNHLYTAAARRAYLIMPNTLNSVALEKTVIDSSAYRTTDPFEANFGEFWDTLYLAKVCLQQKFHMKFCRSEL